MKDLVFRFKNHRGCHGLPQMLLVEKNIWREEKFPQNASLILLFWEFQKACKCAILAGNVPRWCAMVMDHHRHVFMAWISLLWHRSVMFKRIDEYLGDSCVLVQSYWSIIALSYSSFQSQICHARPHVSPGRVEATPDQPKMTKTTVVLWPFLLSSKIFFT